jgi:RNA polymerase sigma factor (sigma-70 family)
MRLEVQPDANNFEAQIQGTHRSEVVEKVFNKYHKKLIAWCSYKFHSRQISYPGKDVLEDIVGEVYTQLMTNTNPIDLTKNESQIVSYLNTLLDHAINNYIAKMTAQKRSPEGGFLSLEEITETGEDEEELPALLKEYFLESKEDKEEKYLIIEQAMQALEGEYKREMDIIRQRYQSGKTLEQVAATYGVTRERIRQLEKIGLDQIALVVKRGIAYLKNKRARRKNPLQR